MVRRRRCRLNLFVRAELDGSLMILLLFLLELLRLRFLGHLDGSLFLTAWYGCELCSSGRSGFKAPNNEHLTFYFKVLLVVWRERHSTLLPQQRHETCHAKHADPREHDAHRLVEYLELRDVVGWDLDTAPRAFSVAILSRCFVH